MNKKGGPASVVFVVFLVVFILFSTLFYINAKNDNLKENFVDNSELKGIYEKFDSINFYIQDIVEKSSQGSSSKEEFLSNLKNYFENSKVDLTEDLKKGETISGETEVWIFPELEEIYSQLSLDKIKEVRNSQGGVERFGIDFEIYLSSERQDFVFTEEDERRGRVNLVEKVEYKYEQSFFGEV
jgi:hypothetical protein